MSNAIAEVKALPCYPTSGEVHVHMYMYIMCMYIDPYIGYLSFLSTVGDYRCSP